MEKNPNILKNDLEKEPNILSREEMESEPSEERYDEKGLTILCFKVIEPSGGYMEYAYMRKGRHENGVNGNPNQSADSSIHIVFYDENDIPYSGDGPIHVFED